MTGKAYEYTSRPFEGKTGLQMALAKIARKCSKTWPLVFPRTKFLSFGMKFLNSSHSKHKNKVKFLVVQAYESFGIIQDWWLGVGRKGREAVLGYAQDS